MVAAVLSDVDGTLMDNNLLIVAAWQRAFRRLGVRVDATALLHKVGMGGDRLVPSVLGRAEGPDVERAQALHGEEYRDKGLIDHAEALPGAAALLRALRARGVRVALASSGKPDEVARYLGLLGGREAVDEVATSADVAATKPSPDVFALALRKLGSPAEAIALGDTVYDIEAARRAGLPCVCVLSGGIERDLLARAGAAAIYEDAADVLRHLDAVLAIRAR